MTNLLVVLTALVAGLVATAPARRQLEPLGWALVAFPVGLLGWTVVALASTVVGGSYTLPVVVVGWIVAVAAGYMLFRTAAAPGDAVRARYSAGEWAVAGTAAALLAASAALFANRSTSVFTFDSFNFYEPYGSFLARTGTITSSMVAGRMVLIPSLHAAGRFFGGEWHFVTYPMAGLVCGLLVVWGAWRLSRDGAAGRFTAIGAGAVALVMSLSPQFRLHSEYVHSHVANALYLLLAVVAVAVAYLSPESSPSSDEWADGRALAVRRAWLAVAGLATVGVALARPDGLAYAFVAVALVIALQAAARRPGGTFWFFAPAIALPLLVVLAVVVREGLWPSGSKLSARIALALLGLEGLAAAVSAWLTRRRLRLRLGIVVGTLLGMSAVVLLAVLVVRPRAPEAFVNMFANLALHGGWGPLWYFVAAGLLICLVCAPLRRTPWLLVVLLGFSLFFAAALVVHGAAHPGRLGWGDSFNRVAFHGLPLAFLFGAGAVAAMLNELAGAWKSRASDRMDA